MIRTQYNREYRNIRKEGETFGRIRSIQNNTEFLYTAISGSEGFTLTSLIKKRGSKN